MSERRGAKSLPREGTHQPQAGADEAVNDALEQRPSAQATMPRIQNESWLIHLPSAALMTGLAAMSFAFDWPDWILFVVGVPAAVLLHAGTRRWLSRVR